MSMDDLRERWKVTTPPLPEVISRVLFTALVALCFGGVGWALWRNNALDFVGTTLVVTISNLVNALAQGRRRSWDDLASDSKHRRLVAWIKMSPFTAWAASSVIFTIAGGLVFGVFIASLEVWVHTWFGGDPANPSLPVTLITLAMILTPVYVWTSVRAAKRTERSAQSREFLNLIRDSFPAGVIQTSIGMAIFLALVRVVLTILGRALAAPVIIYLFNTPQAIFGIAAGAAALVGYFDMISGFITRTPSLIKQLHTSTTENAALKQEIDRKDGQIATLRTQVAVLQGFGDRSDPKIENGRDS